MFKNNCPEELSLFRQAVAHVKPLKRVNKVTPVSKPEVTENTNPNTTENLIEPPKRTAVHLSDWVKPDQVIGYAQKGINSRQLKQFQQGQFAGDALLDLHGLTLEQALHQLEQFFYQARQLCYRHLMIIHGKGSQDYALLKTATLAFVKEQPDIIAYHSAPPKLGGSGVLMVLLKKNP